jgi:hypothetical protein
MTMDSNVVKFPFTASRRAFARKPRWSKNGTPEERAAKATAQEMAAPPADVAFIGNAKPDLWAEAGVVLSKLNVKGRLPEAVKCLQLFLAKNVSVSALVVRQRGASESDAMPHKEFRASIDRLDENNRQYIGGYMQGLIDGRHLADGRAS